jgi:hypothetical protein
MRPLAPQYQALPSSMLETEVAKMAVNVVVRCVAIHARSSFLYYTQEIV